jgi:hypothetical protein
MLSLLLLNILIHQYLLNKSLTIKPKVMKTTNLNPLFIDLIRSYVFIIDSTKPITKQEYAEKVEKTCCMKEPRNHLFYQSILKSDFETIRLSDDRESILFNH